MPKITIIRFLYTGYYLGLQSTKGKLSGKTVLVNYTKSNHALKSLKTPTIDLGNMKLSRVGFILDTLDITHGHFMPRNDQQSTCKNVICGNHILKIKRCLKECVDNSF